LLRVCQNLNLPYPAKHLRTDKLQRLSVTLGCSGCEAVEVQIRQFGQSTCSAGLAVQRNGRINRTSSEWSTITIQDILIKDSIEQRQFDMLQQKKSVANAVIDGEGINSSGGVDLTVGSLINFLSSK
jgi:hypothetical protein